MSIMLREVRSDVKCRLERVSESSSGQKTAKSG